LTRADVHIGDDVWIGAGVMVMPGSSIGHGAVIGAGAVVRGTVAPYEIVVGIPAKSIGSRKNRG
jgi:virginiamycin A acetyltransferase